MSGVLDPRASARVETDSYNNGLYTGENIVPVHLGGVRRRGGLRHVTQLSNQLTRVTSGVTVTAPRGGTIGNANDDNETTLVTTTVNVSTIDPYIVLQYDLGSAQPVMMVDVMNIRSSGGSSTEFLIQWSNDAVSWQNWGPAAFGVNFELVDTTPRSYRRGYLKPNGAGISVRYFRLVKIGGTDMGAVTITTSGMNIWVDAGTISNVRNIPFEVSTEEPYMAVFTDRTISIWNDGALVDILPSPYESANIPDLDASASAETMVIVHEDYSPRFLLRETATNFQLDAVTFDGVPSYDFADASSPTPVSDVQVITFGATWVQGDTFQIDLEGARSGPITYGGDGSADERATTAANITRAVQALYTVEGFEGVSTARTGVRQFTVTFASASAKNYELLSVVGLSASTPSAVTVSKSANGTPRTEPAWSATRGYPRTVTFFEGRLWFGGTRSLQQSLFASEVNNILNFDTAQGLADEPIFVTLSGAQLNAINGLFAGRTLQIFTSGGEFRFVKQQGTPIVPGDAPVAQTQYGAKKVRPVSIDGATLFVQRTGKSVRDFRFNFEEDAYDSLGVSSLAPHLLNDIADIAAWNGSRQDEIGLTFVINADGTAAVFNSRKEANIQAWARWTTQGLFKAVGVVFQDIYFATMRTIGGVDGLWLEMVDDDHYTDCSILTTDLNIIGPGETLIGGLSGAPHLANQEVRVRGDGFTLPNATPNGSGTLIVEGELEESCEFGLNFNPTVTPMPLNTMTPAGPNFADKRRIVKVWVRVRETQGLRCNGRVMPDRYFDIGSFDQPASPVSKWLALEESTNWDFDQDKFVVFDQVDPMPMEILGIKVQLESRP
ncbi:MAG: hypothetical protein LLG14_27260 [Nocardiaceae bacterium]|nr:hypothetical protein [Nocardiaceae bacterium]